MVERHHFVTELQSTAETTPKKGRGRPFQQGNSGKPVGAKNRTTRLTEHLIAGQAETLARKVIERALAGDVRCMLFCLDRLSPKRRGRPIDFELPAINDSQDVVKAIAAITGAVNDGHLTAEEASQLVHVLEGFTRAITAHDLDARLAILESQMRKDS
jgi:hypothetical protein